MRRVLFLLGCVSGCACGSSATSTNKALNIGVLLPFTGANSSAGPNYERGVFLAADQISAAGGLYGKSVHIIEGDTHSDLATGLAAAQQMIAQGVVAIIGPEDDALAQALAPILTSRGIALITPSSSSRTSGSVADVSLWFRLAPLANDLGTALARQMLTDGVRSTVIVSTDDTYEVDFAAGVQARLATVPQIALTPIHISSNTTNFSDTVSAILKAAPDSIVLATDPTTGSGFVNQFSILGGSNKVHWYLTPSLEQEAFVENSFPSIVEGMVGVAPAVSADTSAFDQAFFSALERRGADQWRLFLLRCARLVFDRFPKEAAHDTAPAPTPTSETLRNRLLHSLWCLGFGRGLE